MFAFFLIKKKKITKENFIFAKNLIT